MATQQSPEVNRIRRICREDYGLDRPLLSCVQERIRYSYDVPYSVVWQHGFSATSHLHFANNTLEVIITSGIKGSLVIDERSFLLDEDDIFFVPPGVLHGGNLYAKTENDYIINIKFDLNQFKESANVERLLASDGYSIYDLMFTHVDYHKTLKAVYALVDADDNRLLRTARVLDLFDLWLHELRSVDNSLPLSRSNCLSELAHWTRKNYMNHITIDDAANIAHMSRSYFCKYFKKHMGITYLDYLNRVRINHAAAMLLEGLSASEISVACSFGSLPYFIQLFKKYTGYTTKEYISINSNIRNIPRLET